MGAHNPLNHTDASTLALLLPASEIEVMRIVWLQDPLTEKAIHKQINVQRQRAGQHNIAYTTVMTAVDRLVVKGLLTRGEERQGFGGSYSYTATMDERTVVIRTVNRMLDCEARDYPSAITPYLEARQDLAA